MARDQHHLEQAAEYAIIKAGDYYGQLLLFGLDQTVAGAELLEYLQASPIVYTVYGSALRPDDPAGQFGLLPREATPSTPPYSNGVPQDQMVRVNTNAIPDLSWDEQVVTLGHELGHAALYDNFFLGRPGLPSFIDPAWNDPVYPGGMSDFATHYVVWPFKANELFR
jgi:hypothetical protein